MSGAVRIARQRFHFTCQPGCVACCTQSGEVYLTGDDRDRMAAFLGMSVEDFLARYCTGEGEDLRLTFPSPESCWFLEEDGCSIHEAKPVQCRTFPFWPENVSSRKGWKALSAYCPGIGEGPLIPLEEVRRAAEECARACGALKG